MKKNILLRYNTAFSLVVLVGVLGLYVLVLSTCNVEADKIADKTAEEIVPDNPKPGTTQLQLSSRAFENGGHLPNRYYYSGFFEGAQNLAPPLEWSRVSEEAEGLLLFMYDHDAPDGHHWLIYDIPRTMQGIVDGLNIQNHLNASALADGAVAMKGGGTDKGYYGPSPPSGIHTYSIMIIELQDAHITLSSNDQLRTRNNINQSELGRAILKFINNETAAIEYHDTRYAVLGYQTLEFTASRAFPAFESDTSITGKAGEATVTIVFQEELESVESTKISAHTGASVEQAQTANPVTSTSIEGRVLTLTLTDTLQSGDYIVVRFEAGAVTNKASTLSNPEPLTIHAQLVGLTLSIAGMEEGDELPLAYRSDGDAQSPPVYWAYPPSNAQSFALLLYHNNINIDNNYYGGGKHIWLLYNIPPSVSSLTSNVNPSDYNIEIMQGGNQYGYRPPVLHSGTQQYRLVIVALDKMISKTHVAYNYQANYMHPSSPAPGAFFDDTNRNNDTESMAGLAYAIIDYVEGVRTNLRYDGGLASDPYTVLGTASFDMTISYHASANGPEINMGYYNYLLNNRNAGPFVVLEGYSSTKLNNEIWLKFDEIITLEDASKFIIKKGTDSNNLQVVATTITPSGNEGVRITLGTAAAPVLTAPFDVFDITIQAGAVKNTGNYFNQDISLSYTVQVPAILDTNNYYLDTSRKTLDIFFQYPVMAPYFASDYRFAHYLFSLETGPVNNRSANTITTISANGSVLTLGYTDEIQTNDEIYVSIGKSAIIDAEMGYPNYHTLTFQATVPDTLPANTYPVLESDATIQNTKLGIANNVYVDLTTGTIQVLFNEAIALVEASNISVQSKASATFYSHVALRADTPIEITGSDNDILTIHLADVLSSDIQQVKVKINAAAVQSVQSSVNNYYIVVDHDVHTPQLIRTNPLATSISAKTVALSFKRGVDIVDRTKLSAYMTDANATQTPLQIASSSIQVAGNNQDIVEFELPAFPTVGETLTVQLAAGALKDSATHYKNTAIEVSKKYEGVLPHLDATFQAHLYSLPSPVDIPHNNKYIYIVFDTEEDLEIIETGLNQPYHLPYSLISVRKGTDKNALKSVALLKGFAQEGIVLHTIPSVTQQTPVKGMLTLTIDGTFNTNGEHVEIIIEPGVVRNSAGANEKIIINTQIVVPSVKSITATKNATSIAMEFNREVIYIGPCLSLLETMFSLLQTNPAQTVTSTPAAETITSIYDTRYVDTTSAKCDYNYGATKISGQRSIAVNRAGKVVYPDLQISDDHKTIMLMLSTPITENSLSFDIITLGIADRYSKQSMDGTEYTVPVP